MSAVNERIHVAIFSEGSFEDVIEHPNLLEARAYADGVVQGATYYSGACTAYVLPDDFDEMYEFEEVDQVARANRACEDA